MKTITFLIAVLLSIASFGQGFEGKIIYRNSYKSKLPNATDEQFTSMLGNTQSYYIKGGSYKSETNGTLMQWQLYINKDNKLYSKTSASETLFWNDGAENSDTVLKAEINKNAAEILGYRCDELVLTCKSGVQTFDFNSKISVDPAVFVNHKFGNWYEIISRTKALPLKYTIDNAQFTLESVATEIKPMAIEASFFELPADAKTMKSPY